ncbi:hypothetical protein RclHR1_03440023 [Rhizophagus clarus]|uniref:Transposon Ty3-I Gag-Pol polyprotein n=1 Tax=Rhizophagus clarus TaxID=94130 RepID=A0A2Z6RB70_9GLOM|nr:hypothetical protein RclHR1_03440023 [Rhizophagus clarus]GES95020.1 transposon Ty3-I Gag-Pol polyprotein [Rhizophagus clarus]
MSCSSLGCPTLSALLENEALHYCYRSYCLKMAQNLQDSKGRRARWIMKLQQYDFQIKHRPGKANANADALSRIHEDPVECYMVSIVPSGLNNEEMPEETLNIGKYHGCQQERPFLEKNNIQGKSFLCCQSCNMNQKNNEEICEKCHKSALCTDEWDIYHGFNSYCSIIGDACFINDGHHTHRICFEC